MGFFVVRCSTFIGHRRPYEMYIYGVSGNSAGFPSRKMKSRTCTCC
ncbi:unnamed protein product [Cuscuta epithymum]|uniref:Uncharacterized protein n=1 Tax=Cuscuta epithymum TaxID=186058 RepID=A0AAV0BXC3_9ASTE|nr:unnamed protein product [Cuscuta epithymum]